MRALRDSPKLVDVEQAPSPQRLLWGPPHSRPLLPPDTGQSRPGCHEGTENIESDRSKC